MTDSTARFNKVVFSPREVQAVMAKDLANHSDASLRGLISTNPLAPAEILAGLADDPLDSVRVRLPENPSTPDRALAKLAGDPEPLVRWRVARNDNTPSEALAKLADDRYIYIQLEVAASASSPKVLAKLALGFSGFSSRQASANRASLSEDLWVGNICLYYVRLAIFRITRPRPLFYNFSPPLVYALQPRIPLTAHQHDLHPAGFVRGVCGLAQLEQKATPLWPILP